MLWVDLGAQLPGWRGGGQANCRSHLCVAQLGVQGAAHPDSDLLQVARYQAAWVELCAAPRVSGASLSWDAFFSRITST